MFKTLRSRLGQVAVEGRRLMTGETGVTMAEYALLLTLIAVVVIAGAAVLGTSISSAFVSIAGSI